MEIFRVKLQLTVSWKEIERLSIGQYSCIDGTFGEIYRELHPIIILQQITNESKQMFAKIPHCKFYHQVLAIKQPWMIVTALVEIRNLMFSFTFQSNQNQKLLRLCLKYWITNELFVQNIKLWKFLDSMWCATNQTQTQWQV